MTQISFLITTFSAVVLPFWQSLQCFSFESNQIVGKSSLFVVSVVASMVLLSKACAVFHHGRYKETTSHPIFGLFHYFLPKYSERNMITLTPACLEIWIVSVQLEFSPVPVHDSIMIHSLSHIWGDMTHQPYFSGKKRSVEESVIY